MESALQDNIPMEARLLDIAYRRQPFALFASFAASILLGIALWPVVSQQFLLTWLLSIWLVLGMRYAGWRHYRNAIVHTPDEVAKWRRLAIAGAVASGAIMGLSIYFPALSPHDGVGLLLIIVICGFAAFASSSLAAIPLAAYGFILSAVLPMAFWFFSFGERLHDIMGVFALFYIGILMVLSRQTYAILHRSLELSNKNRSLVVARQSDDLRMQRFFESAPGFFYTSRVRADGGSSMPFASAQIHELFGISPEAVAEDIAPLLSACHPDDVGPLLAAKQESSRTLSQYHFEFRIAHPEKGQRWIEINALPFREENGDTIWHGFMHDVTERKHMESELQQREGEFRTLAENAPDPIYRYDRDCRRIYINPAVGKLTGRSLIDLLGRSPIELSPVPDVNAVEAQRAIQRVLDTGNPGEIEVDFIAANGQRTVIHNALVPEFAPDGSVETVLCIGRDITAHKLMEEVLHRREVEFRTLAENLPDVVIRYDIDGYRTYVNRAFTELAGSEPEKMLGKFLEDTPLVDPEPYVAVLRNVIATRVAADLEVAARNKDGKTFWYQARFVPEFDEHNSVSGVLMVASDITERMQAMSALRESEMKFRTLYDSTGDAVMLLDEQGFFDCNASALKIFGCATQEEFCANHPADLSPSVQLCGTESEELANRHIAQAMQEGSHRFEWIHRRADNNESFPAEVLLSSLKLDGRTVLQATVRDISERKRSEAALTESNLLLRNVLQGIPDPVWMKDAKGAFVVCNHGVARLFNMPVDEIIGKDDYDFFPPEQAEFYQNKDRAALEAGQVLVNEEWWTFGDNGEQVLMETRKTPVRSADGKLLGVLGVARDITARKAAEKAYRESEAMLQEAQRIAHVGSWDVDMVNDRLTWSDETFRIWEIDKTKFKADFAAFLETVHPEDRERVARVYNESVVNHTLYEVEHRLLFPDGRIKHILERGEPQYDEQGKPVRFIGTSLDITERKAAEQALRDSEATLREAQRIAQVGSWELDLASGELTWSDEIFRIFEIDQQQFGASYEAFLNAIHPEDRERVNEAYTASLANRTAYSIDHRLLLSDGRIKHVRERGETAYGEDGKPLRSTGTVQDITGVKELENKLRQQAEFQQGLLDAINEVGMQLMVIENGTINYVSNRKLAREFGYAEGELEAGIPLLDIIHPDDRARVMDYHARRVAGDASVPNSYEVGLITKRGERREYETAGVVVRSSSPWRVITIGKDIAERKRMEKTMAEREREFRSLAGNMPDNMARFDTEGRYLYVNPTHEHTLGMKAEDLIGQPIPDSHEHVKAGVLHVAATGQAIHAVRQPVMVNGVEELHDVSLVPEFDETGKVVSVLGIGRDMTERYRMQETIAAREQEFRSLTENMPDSVVRWDSEGRYTYINPTLARALGASLDEIAGKLPSEAFPDRRYEPLEIAIGKLLASGEGAVCVPQPVPTDDGQMLFHEVNLVVERNAAGEVTGVLGIGRDVTERKRMEATIAAREQEFRSLAESAPDNIVRYDREGRHRYLNSSLVRLLGLRSADEVIGKRPSDTWPDGRFDAIEQAAARAIETGEMQVIEMVAPDKNGEQAYNQIFVVPERNTSGNIIGTIAFGRDVTDLRGMERQLQMVADNLPGAFNCYRMRPDLSGGMLYANKGLYDVFGLTLDDLRDTLMPMAERMHPEDLKLAAERMAEATRTLSTFTGEFRVNHPDKGEIWVQQITTPVYESEGSTLYYGLMFDITERKRMEEQIAQERATLRAFFDAMPSQAWIKDCEGRYLACNPTHERYFGAPEAEVIGKTDFDFVDAELAAFFRQKDKEAEAAGKPCVNEEWVTFADDGRCALLETVKAPVFDAAGKVIGVIGVAQDITERKRHDAVQQRLSRLAESAPGFMFTSHLRPDGTIAMPYASAAIQQIFGLQPTDVEHSLAPLQARIHADDRERVAEIIQKSACQLALCNAEFRVQHPEKGEIWVEARSMPQAMPDGGIQWHGFMIDNTQRKRLELELQTRAQEFRVLVEQAPEPIFRYAVDGRRIYVNAAVERISGIPASQLLDGPSSDGKIVPADQGNAVTALIKRIAQTGETAEIEVSTVDCNGTRRYFHNRYAPELDADGKVVSVFSIGHDITERKQMADALVERQAFLDSLFDAIPVPVFYKDREGRYQGFNRAFETVFGTNREQLIGKSVFDTYPRELAETYHAKDAEVFERRVALQQYEYQIMHANGTLRDVLFSKAAFTDARGEVNGLIGAVIDISERKQMERKLKETLEFSEGVINAIPDLLFEVDREGRYLNIWAQDENLLAAQKELLLGNRIDEVLAPEAAAISMAAIREAEESGLSLGKTICLSLPQGESWFELSVSRKSAGGSGQANFLVLSRDVTERKQYERSLSESRNFLTQIIDGIADPIFVKDREHRWVLCNDAFANLLGLSREALIGKSDYDFFPKEQSDVFWEKDELVFTSGETNLNEESINGPDGEVRYIHTKKTPFVTSDGQHLLVGVIRDITERKRIEEALRSNEEKLSTLFALSPLGIALTDMQGRYVEFNEAFRAICGYPAAELMTLDYWTLTPREYEAKEAEQLESLSTTGRYGPYEKEYRQKDGTRVPIQLNGVLVTGRDGQQYIWSIVEDITARKKSEAELKAHFERILELNQHLEANARELEEQAVELEASQEHLKEALEFTGGVISAIPDILFEMDREGRYLNVWTQNPEVLAAQQAALIGRTVHEILPRETADMALAAIREADEQGVSYGHTIPIVQVDGEMRWYEHSLAKKRGANPDYPTFIVLSRDITERKKSEAILMDNYRRISDLNDELERSSSALEEKAAELEMQTVELEMSREQIQQTEEWYRSIMHSAPDGMLIVDRRGIIMQTNAQLDALFGYGGGELSGYPVEVLVPDAMREKHVGMRTAFHANPEMRIGSAVRNLQGRRKDGTTFPVDLSLSRLPDMDGREGAVCASVRDMSERSKMEAARETALSEALRLAQMRSVFMAQMSHELRTPLNGILGYAQNLLLGGGLGEKEASGLNVIKHSGEHLLSLINGLLDHAAIEADKFELIPDDIRLEEFLAGLIGIIRVRAEQKNVAFACELEDGLPGMVRGDAQRLRQVLLNLLSNAVKFTDAGEVVLRVQRTGNARMRFEVRDSGVGIAPDQLEKIFLPFEQAGEVSRRAGGSGLGLAISRKLVQLMGGDIRVESRPGEGSTFWFEIDLETVQSDAATVNAAALAGQASTQVARSAEELFVPPREELEVLSGLVQRGSMRDVQRYAEQLQQQDERYGPFAEQLRKLAKSFQTKALRGLIEHYLQAQGGGQ